MEQIRAAIRQMISASDEELNTFIDFCYIQQLKKKEVLNTLDRIPQAVYFVNKGLLRFKLLDNDGIEHTTYFASENQFIADYSAFLQKTPSVYTLQALEVSEVVVLPRKAIEWGYENMKEGDKLGRAIAEFYFIYNDTRIKNIYCQSPKERYDSITEFFPNIHNRVPQHMIASYLGITSVHLSRLKKADRLKV